MTPETLAELEFPRILDLVASLAGSDPGKGMVRALVPSPFPREVAERLDRTDEMLVFVEREGRLDFGGLTEPEELLATLSIGGAVLSSAEFRQAFELVGCLLRLRRRLGILPLPEGDEADAWPILREQGRLLADLSPLEKLRARLFDGEGSLRDDASPELARIRRAIHSLRDEINRKAQAILRSDASLFQDTTIVQRGGRFCLPLRADAKGRFSGILHERSQTGATFFVEPFAIVDSNNELADLREQESEEIRRILAAATFEFACRREEIADGAEVAARLDSLQAMALFARQSDAIRPKIGPSERISLLSARHPLIDERLAPLRRKVFGEAEAREKRKVVPVDAIFEPGTRVLVLTGPNAGGKTATLKVVGLFALLAQSGLFVPCASGSTLPVFDRVSTHMGDAQDLLSDLSSFSSYMRRLAQVLHDVGPRSLVLLDELGSATDPEEGGALAAAALDTLAANGATAAVTTHLGFLKSYASQTPGFAVAAMEYDGATGRPTYRVLPGVAGRSLALPLAELAGVPSPVLARARALLGEGWVARERAEIELEKARGELDRERIAAAAARREREEERDRLEAERVASAEANRKERIAFRKEMDRLKRVADETLLRLTRELRAKVAELAASSPRAVEKEVEKARAALLEEVRKSAPARVDGPLPGEPTGPLEIDGEVRLEGLGTIGRLRSLEGAGGKKARVEVGGKILVVESRLLVPLGPAARTSEPSRTSSPSYEGSRGGEPAAAEINLLGTRVEEAIDLLDDFIDRALLTGRSEIRVIHGFGTGRLKAGVGAYLKRHPAVESTRPGEDGEGGGGVTMVKLAV
jgi:DNA mismatch repair protein MutS2